MLTEQDRNEISKNYPALNCSLQRRMIWGTLSFSCSYDSRTSEIIYDDSLDNYISDNYEIRIDFDQHDTFGFPKVFEDSGIIEEFAISNNIKLEDLHINKDNKNSCCLGIFPEYRWSGAVAFIKDKVIPFFYWQSYMRIYDKEPWKAYSHFNKGIVEAMCFPPKEVSKGYNRNKKCPCGSGLKYKKCCMGRDVILKAKLSAGEITTKT